MLKEINYNNLIIGKQYICKWYTKTKIVRIRKIENYSDFVFIATNRPELTFQVSPNKIGRFYEETDETENTNMSCKILEPYTQCPISWNYFEDGDEIITIDDRFVFSKEALEEWLQNKYVNPVTNEEINESQLKYYTVIILP